MQNRFQLVEEEDDSASERYGKFTEANKEAADIITINWLREITQGMFLKCPQE